MCRGARRGRGSGGKLAPLRPTLSDQENAQHPDRTPSSASATPSQNTTVPDAAKQPSQKKRHLSVAEGVAAARLHRALGILRRLAHQDETLTALDALEHTTLPATMSSTSGHWAVDDDQGDTGTIPGTASLSPPTAPSVFKCVEVRFRLCVEEWHKRQLVDTSSSHPPPPRLLGGPPPASDANQEGALVTTSSLDGPTDDDNHDGALEQAVLLGASLDLSDVPLRVEHLPAMVEYLVAAAAVHSPNCNSSSGAVAARALPLCSVDLTGLSTPMPAAHHVLRHLTMLLQSARTVVALHLSDACVLADQHILVLQTLLNDNLNALRAEQAAARRRERRAVARTLRQGRDDSLNFFLWENAERCGLLELEASLRRQLRQAMVLAAQTTLRRAQEAFTRQRQAAARCELYQHAVASMGDFFSQSQHGLIRHQLKFLQQQETRSRHQIVSIMSTALDVLVTANKASMHRVGEKVRNAVAYKREAVLSLLRDERQGRAVVCGEATAFGLAVSIVLHKKYLRGVWKSLYHARSSLFLGPYSMTWTVRIPYTSSVESVGGDDQPLVSCVEPIVEDPPGGQTDLDHHGGASLTHGGSPSYRAERRMTTTGMSKSGGLNDLGEVARAVLDGQRIASPAASITGSKRSSIAQSPHSHIHQPNNDSVTQSPSVSLTQVPKAAAVVEESVFVENDPAQPQADAAPSTAEEVMATSAALAPEEGSLDSHTDDAIAPPSTAAPQPDALPPQLPCNDLSPALPAAPVVEDPEDAVERT